MRVSLENYGKIDMSPSGDPLELSALDKKINKDSDMDQWSFSPAYSHLDFTISTLCQAVKSTPTSQSHTVNPLFTKLIAIFNQLKGYLDEIPPDPTPQRFGNRAYRTWLTKVWENRSTILAEITDNSEAQEYFCQSFGSWSRIDYGTGHEFNFIAFLTCLSYLQLISIKPDHESDSLAIVFDVFPAYWELNIAIQKQYHLEAAGSHGAWGLDDFFSLPFLFGSSQLINHSIVKPSNVVDVNVVFKIKKNHYIVNGFVN